MLEAAAVQALLADNRHIAITGASGWLGCATLDLLARALGDRFAARVSCYGSAARMIDLGEGRVVPQRPLSELSALEAPGVWVLHYAFQTKERAEAMDEAAYRAANQAISGCVIAALGHIDAEAVFVASSGAASKADDPAASPAMRLYGAMKRDDEARFAAWAQAGGRRAVIGRIFNLTGPYMNKHDAYAMASFIRDALGHRPIRVNAPREVVRGYVAIRELMSLVFALLAADGPPGEVVRFDSGGAALELGEVARIVAQALGGGTTERAAVTEPAPDRYVGDSAAYAALLARYGIAPVPLDVQVRETAPWIGRVADPGR
ncbi:NAD(P)-dependent oxidoreductase [Novosphingobium sp. Chol11]|uniref:NAD-dependent epimerase/dehydratase family protein n=1 Tax=Novosphingobium sp. Chol11 TaxID=1385763 RepID=UPI0025DBC2EF|nr:NAD(P)-dependent oxidoreductase [Novosphingobium sp. Chol11]